MRLSFVFVVLLAICCGCCCGRIPIVGFGPDVDRDEVRAAVLRWPVAVDHLCGTELHCEVVADAEVTVLVTAWNPLTDTVVTTLHVEATCQAKASAETFVCAGVLAAVGTATAGVATHEFVTDHVATGLWRSGDRRSVGRRSSGGDWDMPDFDDWD